MYQNVGPEQRKCGWKESKVDWKSMPDRFIYTNVPDQAVPNNLVKTTNTNILTFAPLNIISQLSKSANIYFIIVAILQSIKSISVTKGRPHVLLPLISVMITVFIKDAYEQYSRHQKDKQANSRPIMVLKDGGFMQTTWQMLMIGDVIMLKDQQFAPCDFVVLQTSDKKGRCFVQTKNLDGETHQKRKKIPRLQNFDLQDLTPAQLWKERFQLKYQKPNPFLHQFNGNISVRGQILPLTQANIVLRGSSLQNVDWITGVCVYTGRETKLALNSVQFRTKRSLLDKEMGNIIILTIIIEVVLAFICATMNMLIEGSRVREVRQIPVRSIWQMVGSWWLIMSYFVPISLVVSLELIRLAQVKFMTSDVRMFAPMNKTMPQFNNSSVNQDLGRIRYVFSDKTGTLTSNIMNFKMMSIGAKVYGKMSTSPGLKKKDGITNVDFQDLNFKGRQGEKQFQSFFKVLYLCHEIIVENSQKGTKYTSSSPDQIALLNFAKSCGFEFLGEHQKVFTIKNYHTNTEQRYKLLAILEFSSDRKRMSVIVQEPSGEIFLYIKGADSLIIPRLKNNDPMLQVTARHIQQFSTNGLRTLIFAKRAVPANEFAQWMKVYHAAIISINDRQKLIQEACDIIENNLELVGATGVQDKLQDNVQQTIIQLRQCGIIFYILTGDKRETAVNIGRSCGMISKDTKVIRAPQNVSNEEYIRWADANFPLPSNSVLLLNASVPMTHAPIPLHPTICYRCTPTQKQNIVKSVKSQTDQLTLAIGDGSNDVNMITVADVGIAIRGQEGNDVTRVSDFVIGQFSLLSPLVLYFGRQWYRKNGKFINFGMFKNIYQISCLIGYGAFTMFSGIIVYGQVIYQFFNTVFTIAGSCVYAVADEEYTMESCLKYPRLLYVPGQNSVYFNQMTYWKNIIIGFSYGIFTQFLVYTVMEAGPTNSSGRMSYLNQGGMVIFFTVVLVVNIKILLMTSVYHLAIILGTVGSILSYFLVYFIYIRIYPHSDISSGFYTLFTTPLIWTIMVVVGFVTLGLDLALKKYSYFQKTIQFNEEVEFRAGESSPDRI